MNFLKVRDSSFLMLQARNCTEYETCADCTGFIRVFIVFHFWAKEIQTNLTNTHKSALTTCYGK